MKTKNQTEQNLLELAAKSAANEDGFTTASSREQATAPRMPAWSPYEVWRTRVKTSAQHASTGNAPA